MLAALGLVVGEQFHPLFSFEEPGGKLGSGESWAMKTDRQPGDLGFDPPGLKPTDPTEFKEMQTKEINNG